MIIDKTKFDKFGLKCDRYSEFMSGFREDETGNHHVYPKAIFDEPNIKVKLNNKDHTRAHLYLALDNLGNNSKEAKLIQLGISVRHRLKREFYEEDLKIFESIKDKILYSMLHDSEFQSEFSKRQWANEDRHTLQANVWKSTWNSDNFRDKRTAKLTLNSYVYDLLKMSDNNLEFNELNFSKDHHHISVRPREVTERWIRLFRDFRYYLINHGLSESYINKIYDKYNIIENKTYEVEVNWMTEDISIRLSNYLSSIK